MGRGREDSPRHGGPLDPEGARARLDAVTRGTRHGARGRAWRRLALVGLLAVLAWLGYEAWTWPPVSALATRPPRSTAFIAQYRAEQQAARREDRVQWTWVPYAAISTHVKRAVVVAEDIRFFA